MTASIAMIEIAEILNICPVLNRDLSITMAFWLTSFFSNNETITITIHKIRKLSPTLSIKAISGNTRSNPSERGIVKIAASNAAFGVDFYQNIPARNIATTPGVTYPVKS